MIFEFYDLRVLLILECFGPPLSFDALRVLMIFEFYDLRVLLFLECSPSLDDGYSVGFSIFMVNFVAMEE